MSGHISYGKAQGLVGIGHLLHGSFVHAVISDVGSKMEF
jgi:hypothetical protein